MLAVPFTVLANGQQDHGSGVAVGCHPLVCLKTLPD